MKLKELLFLVFVLLFIGLLNLVSNAQVRDKDLKNETVVIDGVYNPEITGSSKISVSPVINDSTQKISVGKYSIIDRKESTTFDAELIPPAKMKGEPLVKLHRTHLKGGIGNYTSPLFEGYFNSLRSKEYIYSVYYKHFSSNSDLNKTLKNSTFSTNRLGFDSKYFHEKQVIKANFEYDRNALHYYGVNPNNEILTKDSLRQFYSFLGGNMGVSSNHKDSSKINHDLHLAYYNFRDFYHSQENNVNFEGSLSKYHGKELIQLKFQNNLFMNKNLKDTSYANLFLVEPEVVSQGEKWQLKAGLKVLIASQSEEVSYFHFYPDVNFSYNLLDNILIPFIGIGGGMERNSFKLTAAANPFLNSETTFENTNEKINFKGGIRGHLSSTVSFTSRLSYGIIDNMAFFVNDSMNHSMNKFNLLYEDVKLLNLHGEMAYQKFEKLRFILKGDYNEYKLSTLSDAWHKPKYAFSFSANYSLKDKILIKSDVFYQGKRKALEYFDGINPEVRGPFPVTLNGFIDVNLGAEYRYTKYLSAFLNFNNIGAVRYSRWYNYPSQRLNILGGFTYSF